MIDLNAVESVRDLERQMAGDTAPKPPAPDNKKRRKGKRGKAAAGPPLAPENRLVSTRQRQKAFLKAYAECCTIAGAAQLCGLSRDEHYHWLKKSPQYFTIFKDIQARVSELVESVAIHRAVYGWMEPVYYQGNPCGQVRRYDGGLMQFILRGMMPEKYSSKVEMSGPEGGPVQVKVTVVYVDPKNQNEPDSG